MALTVVVVGADLSHPTVTVPVRQAAATMFGPLERLGHGNDSAAVARLTHERDALLLSQRHERAAAGEARAMEGLLRSAPARGQRLVPAKVVGLSQPGTPSRTHRVTIDAGTRDGITPDLTVVSAAGLVGRVVLVGPWTADVLTMGDQDLTVGVRVGPRGVLGALSATAPAPIPPRADGLLTVALVEQGEVHVGDRLTTLGSIGNRPFVPGVPVGTVLSVDPARGQLGRTAAVSPSVDPSTLDIVGVILTGQRDTPRPSVTAPVTGGPISSSPSAPPS